MKKLSLPQTAIYLVVFLLRVLVITQLSGLSINITAHAHQKDFDTEYSGQIDLKLEPHKQMK